MGVAAGARRIIIANQVLQDADLDGLDALLAAVDGLRVWFLVDSAAQLALIEDWAARRGGARVFDVLLEMGMVEPAHRLPQRRGGAGAGATPGGQPRRAPGRHRVL